MKSYTALDTELAEAEGLADELDASLDPLAATDPFGGDLEPDAITDPEGLGLELGSDLFSAPEGFEDALELDLAADFDPAGLEVSVEPAAADEPQPDPLVDFDLEIGADIEQELGSSLDVVLPVEPEAALGPGFEAAFESALEPDLDVDFDLTAATGVLEPFGEPVASVGVSSCGRYASIAARYLAAHRRTGHRRFLCAYFRYSAIYQYCLHRETGRPMNRCAYYYFVGRYFACQHGLAPSRRTLCAALLNLARGYCCAYRYTRNPSHLRSCRRYAAAYRRYCR